MNKTPAIPDTGTSIESRLLAAITRAQSQCVNSCDMHTVFDGMLEALLQLTSSEYGFIGEVLRETDSDPYLKMHAIANSVPNSETQLSCHENAERDLELRDMNNLFGRVVVTGEVVMLNDPAGDRRDGAVPRGYPPVNAFLGMPFHDGDALLGMVGIANRPGGYDDDLVDLIRPFLKTCSNIILSSRAHQAQVEIERSLRESEARGRAILENAIDGIITIDETGQIESCNRAACAIFDYEVDELLGYNIGKLMPDEHAKRHHSYMQSHVEGTRSRVIGVEREVMAKRRDGTEFPVEIAVTQLKLEGRRLFVGILRDITERKAGEERTRRLTAELTARVEELNQLNEQNATLSELGGYLQAAHSSEEAYDVLLAYVRVLFPGESGAFYRLSESNSVECVAAWGSDARLLSRTIQKHDCWALRRGEPHEGRIGHASLRCDHFNGTGGGHHLCVPVMTQNGPIGLLTLHRTLESTAADADQVIARNRSILRGIADRLGPALSAIELRTRLQEDSIRDPLTKLYNRRFMTESLQRELLRTQRAKQPLSLIMLDLDNFKSVNDDYGHDVGDQVLIRLARLLNRTFRQEDLVCRFGGEEFLVILPGADLDVARQRAQQACRAVRALRIEAEKGSLQLTLSAGVATCPEHGETQEALISRADAALYAAKEAGKDRVKLAGVGG